MTIEVQLEIIKDWNTLDCENSFIAFLVDSLEEVHVPANTILEITTLVDESWFLDKYRKTIYLAIQQICASKFDDLYLMPGAVALRASEIAVKSKFNFDSGWAEEVIDPGWAEEVISDAKASFLSHMHSGQVIKDYVIPLWRLKLAKPKLHAIAENVISLLQESPNPRLITEKIPQLLEEQSEAWRDAVNPKQKKKQSWNETISELFEPLPLNVAISTGIKSLDRTIQGGIANEGSAFGGRLIVIGARPGMGKTTIATTLGSHLAENGTDILFFSLEMPTKQIQYKTIACRDFLQLKKKGPIDGPIRIDHLRNRTFSDEQKERLIAMSQTNFSSRFNIYDDCGNLSSIVSRVKLAKKSLPNLRCIFIDYLQLMDDCTPEAEGNKANAVGVVTKKLKRLGVSLDIDIIVLSQLNRAVETRNDKMPTLSDLRDSGTIEQDADIVMFLFRPGYYSQEHDQRELAISVAKNRLGETGVLQCNVDLASSVVFDSFTSPILSSSKLI